VQKRGKEVGADRWDYQGITFHSFRDLLGFLSAPAQLERATLGLEAFAGDVVWRSGVGDSPPGASYASSSLSRTVSSVMASNPVHRGPTLADGR
jgi:hypothetical protein